MKLFCKYGYTGSGFDGFSREDGRHTVEGAILNTLLDMNVLDPGKAPLHASRTDRGVSALGNVFSFETGRDMEKVDDVLQVVKNFWKN